MWWSTSSQLAAHLAAVNLLDSIFYPPLSSLTVLSCLFSQLLWRESCTILPLSPSMIYLRVLFDLLMIPPPSPLAAYWSKILVNAPLKHAHKKLPNLPRGRSFLTVSVRKMNIRKEIWTQAVLKMRPKPFVVLEFLSWNPSTTWVSQFPLPLWKHQLVAIVTGEPYQYVQPLLSSSR